MPVIVAIILAVIGAVAFTGIFGIIGVPVGLLLGAVIGFILMARRRDAGRTIERGRREPTGVPRKSSQGAETANERVGQT